MTEDNTNTLGLPTLNTSLLRDVVTWAVAWGEDLEDLKAKFAEEGWGTWDQNVWVREFRNGYCKTACCAAGQTIEALGYKPVLHLDEYADTAEGVQQWTASTCAPAVVAGVDSKGQAIFDILEDREEDISAVARRGLGLEYFESSVLFDGDNSAPRLVALAMLFAKARGVDLHLSPRIEAIGRQEFDGWTYDTLAWVPGFTREYLEAAGFAEELAPSIGLRRFADKMYQNDAIGDDEYNVVMQHIRDLETPAS